MNVWHGLKTSISRAGTAVNAVGLSPRFVWTLQLRFWRSTAPHMGDSRSTTVFQLQRSPRLGLKQPENSNATPNETLLKIGNFVPHQGHGQHSTQNHIECQTEA